MRSLCHRQKAVLKGAGGGVPHAEIGVEYSEGKNDVSFSPDQALGVLHYIVHTKDAASFDLWTSWIASNRRQITAKQVETVDVALKKSGTPDFIIGAANALLQGLPPHPTYCTDDYDLRCALRPADCALINEVGASLDRKINICSGAIFFDQIAAAVKSIGIPLPELLSLGGSYWNDPGFPQHLASVQNFLLKRLGHATGAFVQIGSDELAKKSPLNPFFKYMANKLPEARQLLTQCPTLGHPSEGEPQQWSWERADVAQAAHSSMYWDCIFMADLL